MPDEKPQSPTPKSNPPKPIQPPPKEHIGKSQGSKGEKGIQKIPKPSAPKK